MVTNRRSILITAAVLLIQGLAGASSATIRHDFERADLVFIGNVQEFGEGPVTKSYHRQWPEGGAREGNSYAVRLNVIKTLKGSCGATVTIVVPHMKGFGSSFPNRSEDRTYLFFLESAKQPGVFHNGSKEYPVIMEAPGINYRNGRGTLTLTQTQFDQSLPPLLGLADLIANQMNRKGLLERVIPATAYWSHLRELRPFRMPWEDRLPAGDEAKYHDWIATKFKQKLDLSDPTVAMNYAAMAMTWGLREEHRKLFLQMFKSLRGEGLILMPPISEEEAIEIFPIAHASHAAGIAGGFSYVDPEKRGVVLNLVLPRLGESEILDIRILETLAKLYKKPELNPYLVSDKRALADKVKLAREIFGGFPAWDTRLSLRTRRAISSGSRR